ncbi:DUF6056 family protein [Prevotella sp. 10(H)]|uniref:DUF3329 domain-containing protein n=1 Tax=Prevotella sp. 10(H) TaxID=1158294 RepID=UPI0004A72BF1|nr:DUF6056 family protein [Prevotella sp. 10(H)]
MIGLLNKITDFIYSAKPQKGLLILFLCAVSVLIFIFNYLFPNYVDDWIYSFVYGEYPLRRVSSLSDIFIGQYNHYFKWGGRSVVHVIAQILLVLPPFLQDVLNTIVFLLFIFAIYRIANYNNKINAYLFIFITILLWFYTPVLTHDILWITGSANYLWSCLLLLAFIYPYYLTYRTEHNKGKNKSLKFIGFLFLGILAGWTNENMAAAMIFMTGVFCIYFWKKNIMQKWAVSGLVGLCIGFIIMVAAPGNYVRMEGLNVVQNSFADMIISRLQLLVVMYHHCMYQVFILYVVMLLIAIWQYKKGLVNRKNIDISVLFVVTAHIAMLAFIGTPVFPLRAMFGVVAFMIVAIAILYANISFVSISSRLANLCVVLLISVAFIYNYYRIYPSISLISETFSEREKFLKEQQEEGIEDIVFKGKIGIHYKFEFQDLSEDVNDPVNVYYAAFYGVRTVKVIPNK